ncbi:MAG TPA: Fe-S protein assembly co-chaperone HscB [Terriglobales bacterium]|nr:Fe-S protein assembly co-chaperone HscB [Terriglobales bacterium]
MTASQKSGGTSIILNNEELSACWSCGSMRAAHFCSSCGKVQPPLPADYFSFFGLPRKLDIDTAALEREFYQLSRKLHPDLYARSSTQEQGWILEKSAQLNDAYRTLKDPIARTEYLLKLEGVQLQEQSKNATDQARATGAVKKQVVPPELLEEVFELNLQLEEARMNRMSGEVDEDLAHQLQQTKRHLQQKFDLLFQELRGYWAEWDGLVAHAEGGEDTSDARRKVCDKMVALLNRRSYIRNLVRDVNEVLEG